MSDINAKNVGAVINNPTAPIYQKNIFGVESPPPLPNNIPSPKGFIGRETELSELQAAYANGKRTFVLYGLGGVGKSELARKFIENIKAGYEAFVEIEMHGLGNSLSPRDVMLGVIRTFLPDVNPSLDDAQVKSLYISLLNQHKTIVFLDNAKDLAQVEPLSNADCCLIVTSRQRVYLNEEPFEVRQMTDDDAKQLLLDKGGEERIGGYAGEIAKECGNLPLALKIIRSLLVNKRLLKVPEFIEKFKKEKLVHLDEVQSSLSLSYEMIGEELQLRWRQLAVFPSSFEAYGAAAIWEVNIEVAEPILDELGSYSLIEFFSSKEIDATTKAGIIGEYICFRLHDLARDYTKSKLSEDELIQAELNHSGRYGRLLLNFGEHTYRKLLFFDTERKNIEAGFEAAKNRLETDDRFAQFCLLYTNCAVDILSLRFHPRDYINWLQTSLKASHKLNDKNFERDTLMILGMIHKRLGEYKQAIRYIKKSRIILGGFSSLNNECEYLTNLGTCYDSLGKYKKAIRRYEAALKVSKQENNEKFDYKVLSNLGISYSNLQRHMTAIVILKAALRFAQQANDEISEGLILNSLGSTFSYLGRHLEAIKIYEDGLIIARKFKDKNGEGTRLGNLGNCYFNLGRIQEAIPLWKEAIRILDEVEGPNADIYRFMLKKGELFLNAEVVYIIPKSDGIVARTIRHVNKWIKSIFNFPSS